MKLINKIEIMNFKSFLKEEFWLDDLTAIVGANESGKTNALKAIYHFSQAEQSAQFGREDGDFRLDAPTFPGGEVSIYCEFILNDRLVPNLIGLEPKLNGQRVRLEKKGKLNSAPLISVTFTDKLTGVADILTIKNKQVARTLMRDISNKAQRDLAIASLWTFKTPSLNLAKNPFATALREHSIEKLADDKHDDFLAQQIRQEILQNIRILFWKYEEDHYLPEQLPIADFVKTPAKYPGVDCMFAISGWKTSDYHSYLIDLDSTTRGQLLRKTQDTVNDLIRKHWSTHKELTVKLNFNGEFLDISLSEPGHETPPNFRSDGFKWFLSFLLFFKKHAANLIGHILLIDEPGGFLHPQGQKDVLKELTALSAENQVIYTTHQTFLINRNMPDSVRIIKREKRGGSASAYDSRVHSLHDHKHILTDRLLREALGFLVSDISPVNEFNILVEGQFDRELLILANKYFNIIDLNDISIIGCSRATNIQKYASLYTANDLRVVGLYDSDQAGKGACRTATGFPKLQLSDIFQGSKETIEDLLPDNVFLDGVNRWKKRQGVKRIISASTPRLMQLNGCFSTDQIKKIEEKHLLEDCLIESVRVALEKDYKRFAELSQLLKILDEKLNGITS